jgi:hypothetical protein
MWVAPELRGQRALPAFYPQADVFSFGVILWSMITSKTTRCSEVPDEFTRLGAACRSQDPAERPSFDVIADELARLRYGW